MCSQESELVHAAYFFFFKPNSHHNLQCLHKNYKCFFVFVLVFSVMNVLFANPLLFGVSLWK